jgi:class 3 adenylate cyclase/tetratricopeptide (TPR) repeat protein
MPLLAQNRREKMAVVCSSCGTDNPTASRFCRSCGAALGSQPAGREARKVVTVLFSDLSGSTALGHELDPEVLRQLMARYFGMVSDVVARYGGTTEKFIGDAAMAVFGAPQVHEDDALRAVQAAAAIRDELAGLNDEFEREWGVRIATRTGVNTGEVMAGDPGRGESFVSGDAVNIAARLEQAADAGEILLGDFTYRLARHGVSAEAVGPLEVKGKPEPISAWRLVDVASVPGGARNLESPLVGRESELGRLEEAFNQAVASNSSRLVTVMGPAGVGKSRLTREFLPRLGEETRVVVGRCLPYGEGITFWPIAEMLRSAAGVSLLDPPAEVRARIMELLSGPDAELVGERLAGIVDVGAVVPGVQETFWAVREFVQELASAGPLVVVFDDIHWAETTLLDLIEYLVDSLHDVPVLLLCLARPELLELRGEWMAGKDNASLVTVAALDREQTDTLIANLLPGTSLSDDARKRILAAAEGNPFFIEETLQMLVDESVLTKSNGKWSVEGDLSQLKIPPTIHAVLAARLDRLGGDERAVIERASVIGRVFWWGAVSEMSPDAARPHIGGHLQSLTRKQLIRPDRSALGLEDAYRFAHILVVEAAYGSIPKKERANLHERFAGWVDQMTADRPGEFEEILGHHLEQAYRLRAEVGPADVELGRRAAEPLGTAGRRAFARGDMPAALNLLKRAVALAPPDDDRRVDLLPDLAFALLETGDLTGMQEIVAETRSVAADRSDARLEAQSALLALWAQLFTDPERFAEVAERESTRAISVFESSGDERGLAKAWSLLGLFNLVICRFAAAEAAWEKAAAHADAAGDERELLESLSWIPLTVWGGPTPVEEGIRRCEAIRARADGDRKAMATALFTQAKFEAMAGRLEDARPRIEEARSMLEDLALTVWLAGPLTQMSAWVKLYSGDAEGAEEELRWSVETLQQIGELAWLPTVAAILAEAIYAQGRLEDAAEAVSVGQESASPDDAYSQGLLKAVQAKVDARDGRVESAEQLARDAVAAVAETDFLFLQAFTAMALGEVLMLLGRTDEADAALEEAIAIAERKGHAVTARKARALQTSGAADKPYPMA